MRKAKHSARRWIVIARDAGQYPGARLRRAVGGNAARV